MEEYNNNNNLSENNGGRANFLYSSAAIGYGRSGSTSGGGSSVAHNHLPINNTFHLHSSASDCFPQSDHHQPHPAVKTEANTSHHAQIFQYPLLRGNLHMIHPQAGGGGGGSSDSPNEVDDIKAKIIAHPQYSNLLQAYMDCQKVLNISLPLPILAVFCFCSSIKICVFFLFQVGAPPEVVARFAAARQEFEARQRSSSSSRENSKDPELDQFMVII